MKALIVSGEDVDNPEFLVPYFSLKDEGVDVDVAYLEKGKIRRRNFERNAKGRSQNVVHTSEYDVLFVSVGKGNELITL
jgi:putative intracellular protease/amidase